MQFIAILVKKSKAHVDSIISKIRQLREQGVPEEQIQHDLALLDRTWYYYNERINKQDKKAWLNVTRTQLEPELLKLKASLERTYELMKIDAESTKDPMDRIEACKAKDDARLSIVQLITEGPDYVKKVDDFVNNKKEKPQMDIKAEVK